MHIRRVPPSSSPLHVSLVDPAHPDPAPQLEQLCLQQHCSGLRHPRCVRQRLAVVDADQPAVVLWVLPFYFLLEIKEMNNKKKERANNRPGHSRPNWPSSQNTSNPAGSCLPYVSTVSNPATSEEHVPAQQVQASRPVRESRPNPRVIGPLWQG